MTPQPTLHDPAFRRRALQHLSQVDPAMGRWIREQGDIWPVRKVSYFVLLCRIILDQQISVQAGRTIFGRWRRSLARFDAE